MVSGDPLITGALIGLALLLVAWLIAIVSAGDVDEGTERVFSVLAGILLGLGSIAVVIIGELTAFVAEAPGMVSTAVAGVLGYLSLSGAISIAPQVFATAVAIAAVVAIAIREA